MSIQGDFAKAFQISIMNMFILHFSMKKTLKKINHIIAQPFIWVIKIYQYTLSPDKGLPSFRLR